MQLMLLFIQLSCLHLSSVNNKKIEIMIDTFNDCNPNNPINQEENEPLSELEQLQDDYQDACKKVIKFKYHLKKLAEFEQTIITFGHLTYEETTEKNEILNQYLK